MAKAVGIDIGGTNIKAGIVDSSGEVLESVTEPTGAGDVRETVARLAKDLSKGPGITGVGIGVAGLLERRDDRVLLCANIPALDGFSFRDLGIKKKLVVENDANAAAFAELWQGLGSKFKSFVLMTLGTGIGAGIVHDGKLLRVSAEAGHMSIDASGQKCPCGNYGCLELYAAAGAIVAQAVKALESGAQSMLKECCRGNIYRVTPDDVYRAALEGDIISREALKSAGYHLGIGITNLITLLSPEVVVLAGGLTGAWDIYVAEAIREAGRRSFKGLYDKVEIARSALAPETIGVIGAAGLVLHSEKTC